MGFRCAPQYLWATFLTPPRIPKSIDTQVPCINFGTGCVSHCVLLWGSWELIPGSQHATPGLHSRPSLYTLYPLCLVYLQYPVQCHIALHLRGPGMSTNIKVNFNFYILKLSRNVYQTLFLFAVWLNPELTESKDTDSLDPMSQLCFPGDRVSFPMRPRGLQWSLETLLPRPAGQGMFLPPESMEHNGKRPSSKMIFLK